VATGNLGFSSIFNIGNLTKFSREEEEAELVEFIVEKKKSKKFLNFLFIDKEQNLIEKTLLTTCKG
jgi:hypothetical protein